jgi:hypothetical protein
MSILAPMALLAAVVTRPVANLHPRPSSEADVVSQAIYGTNAAWLDEAGGWVRVRTPDDYTGWIDLTALRRVERPYAAAGRVAEIQALFANVYGEPDVTARQPDTIALARRLLGLPYLWGGTSTFGYDCSGFTQMLCRRRGISIPRDSGPQARWQGAVERTRL